VSDIREYLVANLFDGSDDGQFTANTKTWVDELVSVVSDRMFSDEDLRTIKWLAGLVKAQALSERNAANRLYIAYEDRNFVHSDLQMARDKIARCETILDKLEGML
jgi:hypothetical protein